MESIRVLNLKFQSYLVTNIIASAWFFAAKGMDLIPRLLPPAS